MDTITSYGTRFLYEETAPEVKLPTNQLSISENADMKPFYFEVSNGSLVQLLVTGGVKVKADPTDASVIWIKGAENKQLIFLTTNQFEAWNKKKFKVSVSR